MLDAVPDASRRVIETTSGSGWISIEHDHYTVDAIVALLGRERAIEFWREYLAVLVSKPLLHNFVSGMIAVIGRTPVGVVRLFAKGWPLVYRDMCEPALIAAADNQPTIRFDRIAPAVRRYSNYLHSWYGACQGYAHIARVRGHVTFAVAPDLAWAEAKFYWEED